MIHFSFKNSKAVWSFFALIWKSSCCSFFLLTLSLWMIHTGKNWCMFSSYHALCIIIIFCTLTLNSLWLPHTQYHTYFNGLFDGLSLSRIYCHPTFASMHVCECIGRKWYMFSLHVCLFVRPPTLHFCVCVLWLICQKEEGYCGGNLKHVHLS